MTRWRRPAAWLAALAGLLPAAVAADEAGQTVPLAYTLGVERLSLTGGEGLGLLGASALFELRPSWWVGPAVYGAHSGRRGGLFVGGVEVQRRWALPGGLRLHTGLFAGGGGGGGASVGSGLMLRPALALMHDLPELQLGLGWSQVRFSGTDIRSAQWGLLLAWQGQFRHYPLQEVGRRVLSTERSGLGVDRLLVTRGRSRPPGGAATGSIDWMGARAEQHHGGWQWGIEAAGASGGKADGYMELLAGGGPLWRPGLGVELGLRGALGLGGGGAVPTGGGGLVKLGATISMPLTDQVRLGAEWGESRATGGGWRARSTQLWLALALEPDRDGATPVATDIKRYAWSLAWQRNLQVTRKDGRRAALDTAGLKIDRQLADGPWYLSAQAHSAYRGGAGAYAVGLAGVGGNWPLGAGGWRVGGEWLLGAAGGGGVAIEGGALSQSLLWVGLPAGEASQWRLGLGRVKAWRGGLDSTVVELSWQRSFGLGGR